MPTVCERGRRFVLSASLTLLHLHLHYFLIDLWLKVTYADDWGLGDRTTLSRSISNV